MSQEQETNPNIAGEYDDLPELEDVNINSNTITANYFTVPRKYKSYGSVVSHINLIMSLKITDDDIKKGLERLRNPQITPVYSFKR